MSWEVKKIGEVCTIEKGNIGITKAIAGDYPLVVLGEERRTHNAFQFDDEAVIIPLVSSTGHGHRSMKRIHYQSGKFSIGNILCAVIPKDKSILSAQYLFRYLDLNKENELVSRMKGMANVSLPMKSIAEVEVPIPPIDEQSELVSKFDSLEESNNTLSLEHTYQLDLLKKLRQQILQDAVQGKLVLQDPNDEPATKLLERIKAEKEKLIREKKIKKEKPLPPVKSEEIPFEIPENWVWCRLANVCNRIHYGLNASAVVGKNDVRLLRITDIQNNRVDWNSVPSCVYTTSDLNNYVLSENDIVIARTGGTIGKSFIVKNTPVKSMFASYLIRVIPSKLINANYIKVFLESPIYWKQLYDAAWGAGQPNVNGTSLSNLYIPIPKFEEQHRIVTKIEQLMTLCDEMEKSIQQNQKYTQDLLQVALKEALEPN